MFQAHFSIEVGSAKHDPDVGVQLLNQLRHRQAGHVLIEGGGEADDFVLTPVIRGQGPSEKLGGDFVGNLFEMPDRAASLFGRGFKDRFEDLRVLSMLGIVPEEDRGKEPFADHAAFLTQHFIQRHADLVGEEEVQVVAFDPDTAIFQDPRQRSQLNRRKLGVTKRHVEEGHLRLTIRVYPRVVLRKGGRGLGRRGAKGDQRPGAQ